MLQPTLSPVSGTGDSQCDSRESFAIETPNFIARQADSPESLEFPIRVNHATKFPHIVYPTSQLPNTTMMLSANRCNSLRRITVG